ncbi:MAG: dUTP diphosphatase, partial [bacterium]|nr:dUTP diphosphatase [bacterium]
YTIRRGERIAQLVVARVESVEWDEADRLSPSERGAGGFGSSGVG